MKQITLPARRIRSPHHHGTSAVVPQTSSRGETSSGVAKSFLRLSFEWDKILPHELTYNAVITKSLTFFIPGVEIKIMEMFLN